MVAAFRGEMYFLSNMFPCRIEHEGMVFTCVEAAFQASKCRSDADRNQFVGVDGYAAKRLGKRVALRADWERRKTGFMLFWLRKKFSNSELARMLLSTGDSELREVNTWGDRYWGVDQYGVGENRLGVLLMQVRAELRKRQ